MKFDWDDVLKLLLIVLCVTMILFMVAVLIATARGQINVSLGG